MPAPVVMIEISRILCPVDFSEFSQHSVHHAIAIARWYGARLTVSYVFGNRPVMDLPPFELTSEDRASLMKDLRGLVGQAASEVPTEFVVLEACEVWRAILEQTAELQASLLVLGSHGRGGFDRLLLGSVTERVLRKVSCPVLVVPRRAPDTDPAAPVRFGRILCPVDFSEGSLDALAYAVSLAEEADADLTLLHVIDIPPELREHSPINSEVDLDRIHAAAEAAARRHLRDLIPADAWDYCRVQTDVREGAAYRQILKASAEERSDLIVMGVQGRGALDLLVFGSNTARVIRGAACPVLAIPGRVGDERHTS